MIKRRIFNILLTISLFTILSIFSKGNTSDRFERANSKYFVQAVYGVNADLESEINRVKVITVNYQGDIKRYLSKSSNPTKALNDLGYPVSSVLKVVSTSPTNALYNNSYILVYSYESVIDTVQVTIPYQRIEQHGTLCKKLSREIVEQKGVLGLMTQTVRRIYERGVLVMEEIIEKRIDKEPRAEIIALNGPNDSPLEVPQVGYNCNYWDAYIDTIDANAEEKQWLKFTMRWESGCNAENDRHPYYKGLYQWDPCLWYKQYPKDNIFDGRLQIKHTLEKLRAGADPAKMWPAVYKKYVQKYGPLSWL
ncbi:MAG: G5 domain-containing protein [Candidatus Dojkabacteria bacterium]|nr:G5 domain-containing protein [Candidatus Dojkabacteria bacterium]